MIKALNSLLNKKAEKMMNQILLFGACYLAFASCETLTFNSITRSLARTAGEEAQCKDSGLFCGSCTSVYECVDLGGGDFLKLDGVFTCSTGSCSKATGNCSSVPNPECDKNLSEFKFVCRQVGTFPHPFNRCQYFMCVPLDTGKVDPVPKNVICPVVKGVQYGFDPYSATCKVKLPSAVCPVLINPCNSSSRGIIPLHPSMHYICSQKTSDGPFLPQLLLCPNGQLYNETTKRCQEAVVGVVDGKCKVKGYFADFSSTCSSYLECSAPDAVPAKRNCRAGTYFDEKSTNCVNFSCSKMQI